MPRFREVRAFAPKIVEADWPASLPCKIAIVGEAPGEEESRLGRPFVGASGDLLNRMLHIAGIERGECLVTNVFTHRPPENRLNHFFYGKDEAKRLHKEGKVDVKELKLHGDVGYLKPEWAHELGRLRDELVRARPNVVIAFGGTALWALTGEYKIGKLRGSVMLSQLVPGVKVVPTYHPAFVIRVWNWLPVVGGDLFKAQKESEFPEVRRVHRDILIEPTLDDVLEFEEVWRSAKLGSYDTETDPWRLHQITCVGLAPDAGRAIVIPFVDHRKNNWSYWNDARTEVRVWEALGRMLEGTPDLPKLAQNGPYDIMWFWKHGIRVRGPLEDTMLMAHAREPEMEKSLAYLATMYSEETMAWKNMVNFKEVRAKAEG